VSPGSLAKSQKTVSTFVAITEYNPLKVCPPLHKSSQELGIPVTGTCPEHSNGPNVWTPEELSSWVRPKFRRVTGRRFLLEMMPAFHLKITTKCIATKKIISIGVIILYTVIS
jgi:hypothetical protein